MLDVQIHVYGDTKTWKDLHAARRILTEELYWASTDASLMLEESAKVFVPKRTTALMKAISGDVKVTLGRMQVRLKVDQIAPYGPWVEYGTGIYGTKHRPYSTYVIGHWPSQMPPHPPVITYYKHPGMMPRSYIRRSIAANRVGIMRRYEHAGTRITRRLNAV